MSFRDALCDLPDLEAELFQLLTQVPAGHVTTYGDLARALGDEKARAARWIGELLKNHPHTAKCACHRVVRSTGDIGHYVTNDPQQKAAILKSEGILMSKIGVVDLSNRVTDFTSSSPLRTLKEFQLELVRKARFPKGVLSPKTIAGVDLAYPAVGQGVGAYVEIEVATSEVIFQKRISIPVAFPYLPGFLSFRELPVLLELLDEVASQHPLADVIFVDGNGILHPWRAGIATCLGVLIDHPTIGIAKSLLCGSVNVEEMTTEDMRPVTHQGESIGLALKTTDASKPVYVSPGHRLSVDFAGQFTRQFMKTHRVPQPIYFADRLTKYPRK